MQNFIHFYQNIQFISIGGSQIGSKYDGPASNGEATIFKSAAGVTGKYLVVQQQYTGQLNLAEVEVNCGKCGML